MPAELDGLCERLRVARVEAGLSFREAARCLEMPPSRLSDLENGREEPYIGTAERMFRVYGYFAGRKTTGIEFTPQQIQSLWDDFKSQERRDSFWRGSPRRA